jgi:tRNA(Met) cytidine acetyltransferase
MVAKFKEIRSKLREAATDDYRRFVKRLLRDVRNAVKGKERRLVVMAGSDPVKVAGLVADVAGKYVRRYRELEGSGRSVRLLHIFHDEFPDARIRAKIIKQVLGSRSDVEFTQDVYEASSKFLGTTYDVLILDLTNDLKPNDVGRLTGVVAGGGLLIFMTPDVKVWNEMDTIFRSNLAVPNHPKPRHVFIKYFVRKLFEHEAIYIFDTDSGRILKDGFRKSKKVGRKQLSLPENRLFPDEVYSKALTQDQVNVIKLVEDNLVPNPGRRHVALVIVADRGRGKSCAIGISLAGFVREMLKYKNRVRIAVTASEPLSVQSLMSLAAETLDAVGLSYNKVIKKGNIIELKGDRYSIEYWEPFTVLKLGVDMVVVDEAAGIPVPLLHRIWRKFRRTIYATTIHGYEGAGRGFQIRFLKKLKEDKKTELVLYEMTEPIRYSKEDPIETFLFDVLKLNAEPDTLDKQDLEEIKKKAFEYVTYDPEYLFSKEG